MPLHRVKVKTLEPDCLGSSSISVTHEPLFLGFLICKWRLYWNPFHLGLL